MEIIKCRTNDKYAIYCCYCNSSFAFSHEDMLMGGACLVKCPCCGRNNYFNEKIPFEKLNKNYLEMTKKQITFKEKIKKCAQKFLRN